MVKIEPPGGDPLRHSPGMFEALNRGKQSIQLDLKTPEGQEILLNLARKSDVVIEGSRPGVAKRLAADYRTLTAGNSRLIYCSISGFGQDGPWRDRPGHDIDYLATSGYLDVQSMVAEPPGPPPILVSDLASGLYAAVTVLAVAAGMKDSDRGTYIDLSMADSALALLAPELGQLQKDKQLEFPNVTYIPHYGVFSCSDGQWISLGIVHEDHFWRRFCYVAGINHLAELKFEERLGRAKEIKDTLIQIFQSKKAGDWEKDLIASDVPAAKVVKLAEVFDSPHFIARGSFVELGIFKYVAQPVKLSTSSIAPRGVAPALDEHRDVILAELVDEV